MDSRRDFIKKAALLSSVFGAANVIPMSIQKAMAINAEPGSTFYDAEHIVFLMQENRSFDHMFGKMKGVRGFNDPRAKTLPNQNKVWLQSDEKGKTYAPFHVDINKTKITWQGGLAHSWSDQVAARNKGKYDKWVPVKSLMTLAYYKREDIPFYYAMADAFTICDHHFCSSLTGTTPNRLFFWTGTIRPEQNGNSVAVVNNSQAESQDNVFVDWQTFPELLEDNDVSWKVYQNELWTAGLNSLDKDGEIDDWLGNYGDNPLEYVSRHNVKLSAYFRKNGDKTSHPVLTVDEVLAKYNQLSQREKNLINKAFTTNIDNPDYLKLAPFTFTNDEGKTETLNIPKEDVFEQFRKDVDTGKLPTVSWLVAPQRFSDHTSSPLYGTWYVSEAIDILTKNPEVWKKTIFILTYDENDGYFDHLAPFVPPKPEDLSTGKVSEGLEPWADYEFKKGSPIGLGYRVPMMVASPWSKGGYVNSQVFDHTSSLMFLENFLSHKTGKKIKSDNISPWRRAICGDLTSIFRPYTGENINTPARLKRDKVIGDIQNAKSKPAQVTPTALSTAEIEKINSLPPFHKEASEFAPVQEKGTRLACALPYQLFVDGALNEDKTAINLNFASGKTAFGQKLAAVGAAFNVYTKGIYKNDPGKTWSYAVKAGDKIEDNWEITNFKNEVYDLAVNGPNGFYRQFKGTKNDPALNVECLYEQSGIVKKVTGNLQLVLENKGNSPLEVQIKDEVYQSNSKKITIAANSKKTITLNLQKSKGWYDFVVLVQGSSEFLKHYAGHVETGEDSITDPFMGGIL
ncbi:phospholipase C, phosphocholine-specific [Pedobacter sp. LMG 31464]|uniref:phospholipase C n=1 Tax=Pedobacter planticolens TaxID=2679964 RepID=A0A923IXV5_9SPHI|nr:phospholipase C, phosphocholine-specific [Pedobacter planticolens]MBB2146742.1 phospholipase C, phosphocholine-specific [Pedobacter planticolens]